MASKEFLAPWPFGRLAKNALQLRKLWCCANSVSEVKSKVKKIACHRAFKQPEFGYKSSHTLKFLKELKFLTPLIAFTTKIDNIIIKYTNYQFIYSGRFLIVSEDSQQLPRRVCFDLPRHWTIRGLAGVVADCNVCINLKNILLKPLNLKNSL